MLTANPAGKITRAIGTACVGLLLAPTMARADLDSNEPPPPLLSLFAPPPEPFPPPNPPPELPPPPPEGLPEPPPPPPPDIPAEPPPAPTSGVVEAALTQVGQPYVWGGASPGGYDCSGLVRWSFQQVGISLPHSSYALARGGQSVDLSDLQPGDVVTFSGASHAGIYIGDGQVVHSSGSVRVVPLGAAGPIYNARRY